MKRIRSVATILVVLQLVLVVGGTPIARAFTPIAMFPPGEEIAKKMQLHHSMRILPHDQNSGGFFVALMKKHDDF